MFVVTILSLLVTGVVSGYLLRHKNLRFVQWGIKLFIWGLLFLLGIEVGGNPNIIKGLYTIGAEAIIITLFAILGSCVAAWGLWTFIARTNKQKGGSHEG